MTTSARTPVLPPPPAPAGTTARRRRWWYVVGVLVAVAALVAGTLVLRGGGDTDVVTPAPTGAPTSPPTSEPTGDPTAEPTPPPVDRSTAVWPWAGSTVRYTDPVAAARGFATEFLGFRDPVVGSFRQGDTRSGEVPVRPRENGPETTVLVRQLSGEQTWSVLGTSTDDVRLTEPAAMAEIRSPVSLRGEALAFEGHVNVAVRQDGSLTPLGTGYVTGGGDVARPFSGSVAFSAPTASSGALVLWTDSAEDGSVWSAVVVRVRLEPGTTPPQAASCGGYTAPRPALAAGDMEVSVWFTCDPQSTAVPNPFRVYRAAPDSPGVLRAAMTALLAGPAPAERDAGVTSYFSAATAGMLRGVSITDGHAVVDLGDLRPVIPAASSSAGSALLLSELDSTVFQFSTVRTAEYRIEGSCTAFTEWLQTGGCAPRTR